MKVLVYQGGNTLAVEDRPDPVASDGEVLLAIKATGICGSDVHGVAGENGRRRRGQVMGHETVGEVVCDPSGHHRPGQLATVNPVIGCGRCYNCARDNVHLCPERRLIGVTPELSSGFAELMVVPRQNVVPLTIGGPPDVGCLVEPLAVGFHAARRGGTSSSDAVWVIGGGPIGQASAIGARRLGARSIVVSEPDERRRAMLDSLGFASLDSNGSEGGDIAEDISRALGGPPSVVLDAVGSNETLLAAISGSAFGARIVLVGMTATRVTVPAYGLSLDERSLIGSFAYSGHEFSETANWVCGNAPDLIRIVDTRITLERAPETFAMLVEGRLKCNKVVVTFGEQ